jgi:predicted RNA methylase
MNDIIGEPPPSAASAAASACAASPSIEKRDFLFRFVPAAQRHQLRLDNEALYSTTDQLTADKITKDLLRYIPKSAKVADATACVGGNTYSFAQHFRTVHAYELDPVRAAYLAHNIRVLSIQNVTVIGGDVLRRMNQPYDLVFIDPPWGGPEYKQSASIQLTLSGKPLEDVCFQLSNYASHIALKTPTNFAEAEFLRETEPFLELLYKNVHLRKMHLLLFRVRPT